MTFKEKTNQLRGIIYASLQPIVGDRCILIGLPYYLNIGDILIWEGTRQFLIESHILCLRTASKETFSFPKLDKSVTILLQGGGNFGDLWKMEQDFRTAVIEHYPENRIVILPQTVYYQNEANAQSDSKKYNRHKNLYICARDSQSFETLQRFFPSCHLLLLPDMAFCIQHNWLMTKCKAQNNKALLLKRTDKEYRNYAFDQMVSTKLPLEIRDWPTMEESFSTVKLKIFFWLFYRRNRVGLLVDWYADRFFRPHMLDIGVEFVSSYAEIYTTRLHVAILSTLLGKAYTFFNNTYGKNKSFYESWLSDLSQVKFIS